jgi:hypothetical protein
LSAARQWGLSAGTVCPHVRATEQRRKQAAA